MMNFITRNVRKWLGITTMYTVINDLATENGRLKRQLTDLSNDQLRLRSHVVGTSQDIDYKMERLDKLATMDLDGSYRGPNTIVLTGVFRGRGYVQFYDVNQDEFHHLVQDFRSRERHAMLRVQDLPHYGGGSFQL